jgi:hypothetical protein
VMPSPRRIGMEVFMAPHVIVSAQLPSPRRPGSSLLLKKGG